MKRREMPKKRSLSSPIAVMMVQHLTLHHRAADPSNPGRRLSAQGALAKRYAAALFGKKLDQWAIHQLQSKPRLNADKLARTLHDTSTGEWDRFVNSISAKDRVAIGKAVSEDFPPANLRKHFSAIVKIAKLAKIKMSQD